MIHLVILPYRISAKPVKNKNTVFNYFFALRSIFLCGMILATMTNENFITLKRRYKTHRAAAKALGVSYSRYNDWRWRPDEMPLSMQRYVELVVRHGLPENNGDTSGGGQTS